jgi:ribosomal protein S18 acetylase RimI-like enzyme
MEILNSTLDDREAILALYDAAIALQRARSQRHWLPFDVDRVEAEIAEGRQWKIVIDGRIACVFLTAESDPAIWMERDVEPSLYLHRIVTDPEFRGRGFTAAITKWALDRAKARGRKFVRLDTWDDNTRLKELYARCGFELVGTVAPTALETLPSHYEGVTLALFEIAVT